MLERLRGLLPGRSRETDGGREREDAPDFGALGALHRARFQGVPCVFVISTGRVGTQTLARMLDLSPHVDSYHEPSPTLASVSAHAYAAAERQVTSPEEWDRVVDAGRAEFVALSWQKQRVYAETNNRLSYLAPTIARFFPASRFVFLHRHPYEVIRSGANRGWYDYNRWDWCRIRPRPDDPYHDRWDGMDATQRIAWLWSATNAFIQDALGALERRRWLELSAADLFADGAAAANATLRLVGVPELEENSVRPLARLRLNADDPPAVPIPVAAKRIVAPVAERLGYPL